MAPKSQETQSEPEFAGPSPDDFDLSDLPGIDDADADADLRESRGSRAIPGLPVPGAERRPADDLADEDLAAALNEATTNRRRLDRNDQEAITYECRHEDDLDRGEEDPIVIYGRRSRRELVARILEKSAGRTGTWRIRKYEGERKTRNRSEVFDLDVDPEIIDEAPGLPFAYDDDDDDDLAPALRTPAMPPSPDQSPVYLMMLRENARERAELRREMREMVSTLRDDRDRDRPQRRDTAESVREWAAVLTPVITSMVAGITGLVKAQSDGLRQGIELARSSGAPGITEMLAAASLPILSGGAQMLSGRMQQGMGGVWPGLAPGAPGDPQAIANAQAQTQHLIHESAAAQSKSAAAAAQYGGAPPAPQAAAAQPAAPQAAAARPLPGIRDIYQSIAAAMLDPNRRRTNAHYWAYVILTETEESELATFLTAGPQAATEGLLASPVGQTLPQQIQSKLPQWMDALFAHIHSLQPPSNEQADGGEGEY